MNLVEVSRDIFLSLQSARYQVAYLVLRLVFTFWAAMIMDFTFKERSNALL